MDPEKKPDGREPPQTNPLQHWKARHQYHHRLGNSHPGKQNKVEYLNISTTNHRALKIKTSLWWRQTKEKPLRHDKANWAAIETEVKLLTDEFQCPKAMQKKLSEITLRHTPRATGSAKAFWNKELTTTRKRLLDLAKQHPHSAELVEARRNFRKMIANAKLEANGRILQEEADPECFRSVKYRTTKHPIPALERTDGSIAAEHDHIADELQNSLYEGEHQRPTTQVEKEKPSSDIDIGEINLAIKASPNGAASGPDHITTRLLRILAKEKEDLTIAMFNRAFQQGAPTEWKASSTILIPKARKPTYSRAKSWRPIQLQSIMAKTLERIITNRLSKLNLLGDNMYGGRKGSGTTDAFQALDGFIHESKDHRVCLTALDIEGGFDNLDLNRVCEIIATKDKHLATWIQHWGSGRQTHYRFNGRSSKGYRTDRGTPQGSPMSPILFLISIKAITDSTRSTVQEPTHASSRTSTTY
jgi:hypothetical protein